MSDFISIIEEGGADDWYYIQFKSSINISYSVTTDVTIFDTDRQTTYYQDQYSYSGTAQQELEF